MDAKERDYSRQRQVNYRNNLRNRGGRTATFYLTYDASEALKKFAGDKGIPLNEAVNQILLKL